MSEFLLLKLRNAIADKEFYTAAGNHELEKYGQWACDWYTARQEINVVIETTIAALEAEGIK